MCGNGVVGPRGGQNWSTGAVVASLAWQGLGHLLEPSVAVMNSHLSC